MKKQLLLMGLATAVLLGACSKGEEKQKEDPKVEVSDEKEPKEVKGAALSKEEKERVVLTNELKLDDKELTANVFLENKNAFDIPVSFEKDTSVEVRLLDANGKELEKKVFDENERTDLKAKETLSWEQSFNLKDAYGTYKVEAVVHVKQKNGEVIQEFKKTSTISYEQKTAFDYTPGKKSTFVYANNDGSGNDITEEFLFFENGYAQAYNTVVGGNVVYYTDKTGYYRVYTEVGARKDNIIKDIEPRKELLLPLPVEKGATWESEGAKHKVVEADYTLDSKLGKLEHVAIVEADIGQKVHLYYHKDYGLVRMDVDSGSGTFEKMWDLKEVKQ